MRVQIVNKILKIFFKKIKIFKNKLLKKSINHSIF
jgi:hypothetical protein